MAIEQKAIKTVYEDGSVVWSNLRNKKGIPVIGLNDTYTASRVTQWYDGTPMTDLKADGEIWFKERETGQYFRANLPNWGETFLEKDTMAQMRALPPTEILLLKAGYYKGIKLNGYREDKPKFDKPINYYLSENTADDDEGSVIAVGGIKLEHKFTDGIDVRYFGCFPDVNTVDASIRINKAIIACNRYNAKRVIIPKADGIYYVNAGTDKINYGIKFLSGIELVVDGHIKAMPSTSSGYCIVSLYQVLGCKISGSGTIQGERIEHIGSTGEWGMGISVMKSEVIQISGITVKDCWGDGIYTGGDIDGLLTGGVNHVIVNGVHCLNNRRQGMSITYGNDYKIINSTFELTNGTNPQAGLDIEPNTNQVTTNISVSNCHFKTNTGNGIQIYARYANSYAKDITISNCTFDSNLRDAIHCYYDKVSNVTISNITCNNNGSGTAAIRAAIKISEGANNIAISTVFAESKDYTAGLYVLNSHTVSCQNLNIKGAYRGVKLENANSVSVIGGILNCEVYGAEITAGSSNNRIQSMNITKGNSAGVFIENSDNNHIKSLDITGCARYGIRLNNSDNNYIFDNFLDKNGFQTTNSFSHIYISAGSQNNDIILNKGRNTLLDVKTLNGIFVLAGNPNNKVIDNDFIDSTSNIVISDSTTFRKDFISTSNAVGGVKQSAKVDDVSTTPPSPLSAQTVTTIEEAQAAINNLVTMVNAMQANEVELKTKLNAKLVADRDSLQQSTT